MAWDLTGITNSVKNGFVTVQNMYTDWLTDSRPTNTNQPRVQSADPTAAIDKPDQVQILNFPHDRPKYFISFRFEEYRRPNQFEGLKSAGTSDYISLPLPNNLQDKNVLNYSDEEGLFLIEAGSKIINNGVDGFKRDGVDGFMTEMKNTGVSDLGKMLTGATARGGLQILRGLEDVAGAKGFTDGALQTAGLADNPFSTVQFKGPNFKTHAFTWRLSAKNAQESATIKKICDTFKKVAYPELLQANVGGFYKYPHIVLPSFHPDTAANNLYKFKPCVIEVVNVDFAPNDRPGFYGGTDAPLEVVLELQLKEIELWRNGDGTSIKDGKVPTVKGDFTDVQSPPVRNLGTI